MNYLYYPGCSLTSSALEYHLSTLAVMEALGVALTEIEDWTCCGAGAAESISHLLPLALSARNLALAEAMGEDRDILAPCSACYLNLKTVTEKIKGEAALLAQLNAVLKEEQLVLEGRARVRHLLDVMTRDVGAGSISPRVKRPLCGMRIAPYYGCQCLRPYAVFDDPEKPMSMEPLIQATGASVHNWGVGSLCCSASHINTHAEMGIQRVAAILKEARGADAIVTVCPMCQMNLEAYQQRISRYCGEDLAIPVLYLPQFLGLAMGLPAAALRLDLNLSAAGGFSPGPEALEAC